LQNIYKVKKKGVGVGCREYSIDRSPETQTFAIVKQIGAWSKKIVFHPPTPAVGCPNPNSVSCLEEGYRANTSTTVANPHLKIQVLSKASNITNI
jgi:putative hemolysin